MLIKRPLSNEKFIEQFAAIIDAYRRKANQQTVLPWFLDGKAGEPGLVRLRAAEECLKKIRNPGAESQDKPEYALYKVCQLFDGFNKSAKWRSRLIDSIGRLLDAQLKTPYMAPKRISSTSMIMAESEHNARRMAAVAEVIRLEGKAAEVVEPAPNPNATLETLKKAFEQTVQSYNQLLNGSKLPWFFSGRPGKVGVERLGRAETLLGELNKLGADDYEQALSKVCEFYRKETSQSNWRSRLMDNVARVLDVQLNTQYNPQITTSYVRASQQVFDHEKARERAIDQVLAAHANREQAAVTK